jgi:hypothetical protein
MALMSPLGAISKINFASLNLTCGKLLSQHHILQNTLKRKPSLSDNEIRNLNEAFGRNDKVIVMV